AGDRREQRVVAAAADVGAGVELGAPLPNEDLAGVDDLAAEALHTEALRGGVAPVPRRGGALLVSHGGLSLLGLDPGDLDLGVLLAVPQAAPVSGLVLEVDDLDLRALGGAEHLRGDRSLAELARAR